MGGVHIDNNQTLGIFRQDIHPFQLGNGITQGRDLPVILLRHSGHQLIVVV